MAFSPLTWSLLILLIAINIVLVMRMNGLLGFLQHGRDEDVLIGQDKLVNFGIAHGTMRMMWSTPILKLNLLQSVAQSPNAAILGFKYQEVLALILKSVRNGYQHVAQLYAENITKDDPAGPNGLNSLFFRWQTKTQDGWRSMFETTEALVALKTVEQFWQTGVDIFLAGIGQSEEFIASRSRTLHPWATVHSDCFWHDVHTHPQNLVSGVFYVSVPPGSGKIVFYDPRGKFPPFDDTYDVYPEPGDLIIFPSWLPHLVSASRTTVDNPRVSIAFNIEGSWYDTSAVSTEFPVIQ